MKIILGVLTALVIVALLSLPIPMPGDVGAYNTISRTYWCKTEQACIHERAHQMDQERGWVSQGDEFGQALEIYEIRQITGGGPSETAMWIWDFPGLFRPAPRLFWNTKAEIYAEIYTRADGKVAEIIEELRRFYD